MFDQETMTEKIKIKTVIMAGGEGRRISEIAKDTPKPMIRIEGKPVLEHEIECLKENGFTDIIITVSYLKEKIMDYFKDGKDMGVNIEYYIEDKPLGNAGALYEIRDKLSDDFLLLNADSIFDVDIKRFVKYHIEKQAFATIMVHPTTHPEDCGLVFINKDNIVTKWLTKEDERPEYYRNKVNTGLHILNKKLLEERPSTEKVDLDRQILKPLVDIRGLCAYESTEYFKDMGTPERYEAVCNDFKTGIISKKSLKNKQKAIFINLNELINTNNFILSNEMIEAIHLINNSGYLAFGIINDTKKQKEDDCSKLDTLLSKRGIYFDNIFTSNNNCLVFNDESLLKISNKYNIDLSVSWIIDGYQEKNQTNEKLYYKAELLKQSAFIHENRYTSILDIIKKIIKYI